MLVLEADAALSPLGAAGAATPVVAVDVFE
jgi:hypothetical protein